MLAFPASLKAKLAGMALGAAALTVVNSLRVVSLVYVAVYYPNLLKVAHLLVWQPLMILLSVFLFLFWVERLIYAPPGMKLILTFARSIGLLVVLVLLWLPIASTYTDLLTFLGARVSPDTVQVVRKGGVDIGVSYSAENLSETYWVVLNGCMLYSVLLIPAAAILGTMRARLTLRLLWLLAAAILAVIMNLVTIAALARGLEWTHSAGPLALSSIGPLVTLTYVAFPFVMAGAWVIRRWQPVVSQRRRKT